MTDKYLFDTTWLIDAFQKQDKKAQEFIIKSALKANIAISAISITEIRAGLKGKQINYTMPKIQTAFTLIPIDYEVSEKAGDILSKYYDNGLSLGDAIIAASALIGNYKLITHDHGFNIIKELQVHETV